jgi:hypothetical protein
VVAAETVAHRGQCRAVALVKANDELIGDEAVHLGHALPVGSHAEGDDVHEVAVVIDAGPLAEPLYCLYGHRVEVEGIDQQPRDIVVGSRVVDVEIEPEKCASGRCLLDLLPGCVGGRAVLRESALHARDILTPGRRPCQATSCCIAGEQFGHAYRAVGGRDHCPGARQPEGGEDAE